MAFPKVESASTKLSFAKIAAMPAPSMLPALPNTNQDHKSKTTPTTTSMFPVEMNKGVELASHTTPNGHPLASQTEVETAQLAMKDMKFSDKDSPNEAVSHNETNFEDGQSNVSTSPLKQQSFDTKSIASVTTFAMDEKESIRPDDSASVRAAEDDDSNPGISRHSSFQHEIESAQRGPARATVPHVSMAARRYPGLVLANPPRFGDLPISPVSDARASEPSVSMPSNDPAEMPILAITPDEKLIEALASPKDRLPLLQLEEKFMTFITYGRDDILELPPQNSFTRLLTHKLADYYGLAHQVNEDSSSVRIFRTQPGPLPVSLADMAKSIHMGPQSASTAMQIKIMRRVQLGRQMSAGTSTAASSSVPSKATSENGGDINNEEGLQSPYEGTPGREKLKSREEREAQYKAVRDRIFGDFQESVTSESGSTGETSASLSRSSSTSGGKKKSRKSKTPKDDTFTRRSEFIAYGPMHMQQGFSTGYNDVGYQDPFQPHQQAGYPGQVYGHTTMQQYPQYDQSLAYGSALYGNNSQVYSGNEGWSSMQQSSGTPVFNMYPMQNYSNPSQMSVHPKDQFTQHMQPMSAAPAWSSSQSHTTYPQNPHGNNNGQWQNFNPSPGMQNPNFQLAQQARPMYANDNPYAAQSPLMPAFNNARSLFNPQTRSFVPNNTPGRGGNRQSRKKGAHHEPNTKPRDMTAGTSVSGLPSNNPPGIFREDSLQQKYGAPANLPKKPPASQVSPLFTNELGTNSTTASMGTTNNAHTATNGSKPTIGV